MKKILITGCDNYQNKGQISQFLYELKTKYKNFKIATLAKNYGADKLAKKYALEFNISYGEFNPYHCHHKMYDIMPPYMFNKRYHGINFLYRDIHAIAWADIVIIFIGKDYKYNKRLNEIVKSAKKKDKVVRIIQG